MWTKRNCLGIGIVIRDVLGVVTAAQSIKLQPAKTSMEGQILATVAGIQLALRQNCHRSYKPKSPYRAALFCPMFVA